MMQRKKILLVGQLYAIFVAIVFWGDVGVLAESSTDAREKIKVFVSILPQAYFVERVGSTRVGVCVMVGPGHSPATYEPKPKQMARLSQAKLYFRIGVPFENVWIERIRKANPHMKVIDTRQGIELLPMRVQHNDDKNKARHRRDGIKDPHIWLSLRLVKIQAQNICKALVREDPDYKSHYEDNLAVFCRDLDQLDAQVSGILDDLENRSFMVFHPSWGYFARDYGLEQVPVEIEGKKPSAKTLAHVIERAKQKEIRVVFVQQQFSKKSAQIVARTVGARIVQIDPLARNYLTNMAKIAETFAKVMQ